MKARSRGPLPPTAFNLQPPPSRIAQSVGSGTATPTTGTTTTTGTTNVISVANVDEDDLRWAHRPASLARAGFCRPRAASPPPLSSLSSFSALKWCEYYGAAFGLRAMRLARPTLKQINVLPPLSRIAGLAGFPSRFAREGPGFVYVLGLVDDWNLGDWHAHRIGDKEFIDHFRVKIGAAVDVPRRQRGRHCPPRRLVSVPATGRGGTEEGRQRDRNSFLPSYTLI
ncbi:hypothetical protein B0H16DRAFT_1477250 [Mycena metata]|uniref:Uncharacterized protein n=1 Tax=Mycena metata TaxID=1033252 RepID=A0AAD7HA31_9AGAR|nr:hypothetical protein B0H16DRAFT_1477250 [Mycena metata]